MITLVSDPSYSDNASPENISRWLATESPNNFRLHRLDFNVISIADVGSPSATTLTLDSDYTGTEGNVISLYSDHNGAMYTGTILSIDVGLREIITSINYDAAMTTGYLQDNTLHGGYYFEGRLTINDVVHSLTIYATPDTTGIADLDVSGILRIVTTLIKTGAYSLIIPVAKEPTKSGKFTFEYRECWDGSDEAWTQEGNIWYYGEVVRSEEQGSNLHDYVTEDAPFLNLFERPVYFLGLPFDLSFILTAETEGDLTVTIRNYNSSNTPGTVHTYTVTPTTLKGFINSLTIDSSMIDEGAAYITAEVS
jgi:hypothetical protein